jgi:4-aminobutyrate aminotransferase / (S)-3-amino-2-methylpropionate transaminase / 5-aminovalerate transaminase
VLEPVAGEGGFIPVPERYLRGLRAYADQIGALWIDDEVQAGMGRTGHWWAVDRFGLEPDLVCTAKALASGFPLAAVVGKAEVMDKVEPGMLGSTFGGNPAGCAAALATIEVIEEEGLLARATAIGEAIPDAHAALRARVPALGDVRGPGAMVGLEFVREDGITPDPEVVNGIVAGPRARPHPAADRHLRQRHPAAAPAAHERRRARSRGLDLLEEAIVVAQAPCSIGTPTMLPHSVQEPS